MAYLVNFTVNGERYSLDVPPYYTLLRLLRDRLVLTGTKNGCSAGECGACTVLMDGVPVNSLHTGHSDCRARAARSQSAPDGL